MKDSKPLISSWQELSLLIVIPFQLLMLTRIDAICKLNNLLTLFSWNALGEGQAHRTMYKWEKNKYINA